MKGRNGYKHVGKLDGNDTYLKDDTYYKEMDYRYLVEMSNSEVEQFKESEAKIKGWFIMKEDEEYQFIGTQNGDSIYLLNGTYCRKLVEGNLIRMTDDKIERFKNQRLKFTIKGWFVMDPTLDLNKCEECGKHYYKYEVLYDDYNRPCCPHCNTPVDINEHD